MNKKIKFYTILIGIAVALTACSGLPEEIQVLDLGNVNAPEQALPDEDGQQPPEGQGPQGQGNEEKQPRQIDLAAAASVLGVTEEALSDAMGERGDGKPDFATVAAQLGVTEEELSDALGIPVCGPKNGKQGQGQNGPDAKKGPRVDLEAAASELGVSEEALKTALGERGEGPPDFAAAAEELGVSEEELINALGVPAGGKNNGQHGQGQNGPDGQKRPRIDLEAAASELGVTEEALKTALGERGQGPPDFAAAAAELGVTEEALIDALEIPAKSQ